MFRHRELTLARSRNSTAQAAAMASRSVIFLTFINGWSGLELSLTCRQGDFAEDLEEEGKQGASVRDKLTDGCRHSRDAYKQAFGQLRPIKCAML